MQQCLSKSKVVNRHVIVEKDIDANLCIKVDELRLLFDYYKPFDPRRIGWMILATCGLRPSEVAAYQDKQGDMIGLTYNSILNNFQTIRYKVRKPTNKYYAGTKTLVTVYKMRSVRILYETLRYELKAYCLKNYHSFKNGKLLPYSDDMFRRELKRIRDKIKAGRLDKFKWAGFTEPAQNIVWAPNNDAFRQRYRITPYSCRRFYNTYKLWTEYGGNIVLSTRDMGHNHVDTNMIYSYSPDKIGLTNENIKEKATFDMLFGGATKGQMSLKEFG